MNSKNISILFISLLLIISATSLLLHYNDKPAGYTPPPPDFESNQSKYNDLIKKAQTALDNNELKVAYENFKGALKYYPGNQGILQKMGLIKLRTKDFKEAEKIYSDLCKSSPDQPTYQVSLATSLIYQDKHKEAELVLEQAKRLRANDARVHLVSSAINARKKLVKETLIDLKRYPIQQAILSFTKEKFFDEIRNEKEFQQYINELTNANKKDDQKK